MNKTDRKTNGFYVIMFTLEAYTLHYNTTIDGNFITSGGLVVKVKCLFSVQVDTNCYWNKHPQHHVIIVSTSTIIRPRI